jgi:hypothetical protein
MSLILQELGIVVAMQQPNPNLVTVEFLQLSGIIPTDWQLASEPVNNPNFAQLQFTNGFRITAEPNRIMFGENIGDRDVNTLTVAQIANRYVSIFQLARYAAIGINIRSYSPQPSIQTATEYLNTQLLSSGSWQQYGAAPVRAALKLVYTLPGRELNLDIAAAGMQFADREIQPVILFSGNFTHNLATSEQGESAAAARQVLTSWQTDLSAYCELITDRFLNPDLVTVIPSSLSPAEANIPMEIPYAPDLYPKSII